MKIIKVISVLSTLTAFACGCNSASNISENISAVENEKNLWFANLPLNISESISEIYLSVDTCATAAIIKEELSNAFEHKPAVNVGFKDIKGALNIVCGYNDCLSDIIDKKDAADKGNEGFIICRTLKGSVIVYGNTSAACMYGVYALIRKLVTGQNIEADEKPAFDIRMLNHWDNIDGSVERGYAGASIWFENGKINPRSDIKTYARANASVGINAVVLNNVNASPEILSASMLGQIKTVADSLRRYGIKVWLSINFSSPKELGKLSTSDPLDSTVINWWKNKAAEIYNLIPDFGGFLVKANSEGLPGPMDYGRTHAQGADMLAAALEPYGGKIIWRAFVYQAKGDDRAKQAYNEFMPPDGKFNNNVIIQVKNGPVDFQPREPFSPLFGAMQHTDIMPEFQITQEYLGFSIHLCYLAPLFSEFFNSPTYRNGQTIKQTLVDNNKGIKAIAGVANTGRDNNWCGYVFAQSNWYAFGRLAWNPDLKSEAVADEWIKQTFKSRDESFIKNVTAIMTDSRQAAVNYMTPLGLHHLMGWANHYGPQPYCDIKGAREDWMPRYYHKADNKGLGFNRSTSGSGAVCQYADSLMKIYNDKNSCPAEYLLWFHHVGWNDTIQDGSTLWESLVSHYRQGVKQTENFQKLWNDCKGKIPEDQFEEVSAKLKEQNDEAIWWNDACLIYFSQFAKKDYKPLKYKTLDECESRRLQGEHWK